MGGNMLIEADTVIRREEREQKSNYPAQSRLEYFDGSER